MKLEIKNDIYERKRNRNIVELESVCCLFCVIICHSCVAFKYVIILIYLFEQFHFRIKQKPINNKKMLEKNVKYIFWFLSRLQSKKFCKICCALKNLLQ